MTQVRSVSVLATVLTGATLMVGCGGALDYRFDSDQARAVPSLSRGHIVVSGAIDSRTAGSEITPTPARQAAAAHEMQRLAEGVQEHLQRAGLSPEQSPPAPRSDQEVHAILAEAARSGAEEVWFPRFHGSSFNEFCMSTGPFVIWLGILPWLILDSLPINAHGGLAGFEVVVVDPQSGDVLTRVSRLAAFHEQVSAWGCGGAGIMREMLGRGLQAVLEGVEAERRAGWPEREHLAQTASTLLGDPALRVRGDRLFGIGWSIRLSPGWSLLSPLRLFPGSVGANLVGPAGATAQVHAYRSQPGAPERAVFGDRHRLTEGAGAVTLTCPAPGPRERAACTEMFASLRISMVSRR